ncbi:AHH domain-containing protein [Butyrivibrio sp. VCB2001]|uniref:AHH domain-containing protein n=1 Tax=Butyrivibrio sp. VCB2001 TaxID=1280667 RepID=UPI000421F1FE|nr:AHH domain-containing protein [Butyrivibrio sp. VCB2001]
MNELGLSAEYEAEMKNIDFGDYLRTFAGDAPEGMYDPHAHHILFKNGNGEAQQALVEEGQAILREYGLDPVIGHENLVWAPNRVVGQHAYPALEKVVNSLRKVRDDGGTYEEIVEVLQLMGNYASLRTK